MTLANEMLRENDISIIRVFRPSTKISWIFESTMTFMDTSEPIPDK